MHRFPKDSNVTVQGKSRTGRDALGEGGIWPESIVDEEAALLVCREEPSRLSTWLFRHWGGGESRKT